MPKVLAEKKAEETLLPFTMYNLDNYFLTCFSIAASSAGPLRFVARTFPFPSIKKLVGIEETPYVLAPSEFQPLRSLTWYFQVSLSCSIAFFHASAFWSNE